MVIYFAECYPQASAETVWIWSRGCA